MHRIFVIASFQKCHRGGSVRTRTRLGGRIGSIVQVTVSALFQKNGYLVGLLGSRSRLVSRIGSGPRLVGRVVSEGIQAELFRSSALSFPGAKSPQREISLPWNFRSVEHLLLGTFAPVVLSFLRSERSKNFRCYETVVP